MKAKVQPQPPPNTNYVFDPPGGRVTLKTITHPLEGDSLIPGFGRDFQSSDITKLLKRYQLNYIRTIA